MSGESPGATVLAAAAVAMRSSRNLIKKHFKGKQYLASAKRGQNLPHCIISVVRIRRGKVRVIENVEELAAELQPSSFADWEILVKPQIKVIEARSHDRVATGVSMPARWHVDVERAEVEPLVHGLWPAIRILPRHCIRSKRIRVPIVAETRIVYAKRRKPVAGLDSPDSVGLPSSQQGVDEGIQVRTELAALTEWQIVDGAEDETVADIEVGGSVFPIEMSRVAERVSRVRAS